MPGWIVYCIISGEILFWSDEGNTVDNYDTFNEVLVRLFRDIMDIEQKAIITPEFALAFLLFSQTIAPAMTTLAAIPAAVEIRAPARVHLVFVTFTAIKYTLMV